MTRVKLWIVGVCVVVALAMASPAAAKRVSSKRDGPRRPSFTPVIEFHIDPSVLTTFTVAPIIPSVDLTTLFTFPRLEAIDWPTVVTMPPAVQRQPNTDVSGSSISTGSVITATSTLGNGGGVLTLPRSELTGTDNLVVAGGGELRLEGTNTYPDFTTFNINSLTPIPEPAADVPPSGSTLKYVGGATSTDLRFTTSTLGATIDASGSGTLTLFSGNLTLGTSLDDSVGNLSQQTGSSVVTTPEPSSTLLAGLAAIGMFGYRRRLRAKHRAADLPLMTNR